jgi:hypothetical protein
MADPSSSERSIVRAPPSGRVFTRWTTDDLEIAEALTGGGQLQRAADLCWALLGDGRVRAALETRVKGLLRLPLAWEEAGDRRSSGRVARALEGGDWYAAHSEAALASLTLWGILLGVGLAQRVWELRDGRWLGVLRPYDVRNLRWDQTRRRWLVRTATGEIEIVPGDRRWVLYAPSCSGTPDGDERPWMYGAWRACARPWHGKQLAWGDWQHHGELHGSPIRTADVSEEKPPTAAVREDFCNALADIGADTALIPPPGLKLRLLEPTAATWKMFPGSIDAAAKEIVIAVTGQSSSTEINERQQTGATLHQQVRQDLIDADAKTLSTCLHDQDLGDYTELNFGNRALTPWPRWETDPPADVGARGDAMKKLGDGIASLDRVAPEGKRVDRAAVFEDAGIPLENIPPDATPPATQPAEPTQDEPEDTEESASND